MIETQKIQVTQDMLDDIQALPMEVTTVDFVFIMLFIGAKGFMPRENDVLVWFDGICVLDIFCPNVFEIFVKNQQTSEPFSFELGPLMGVYKELDKQLVPVPPEDWRENTEAVEEYQRKVYSMADMMVKYRLEKWMI